MIMMKIEIKIMGVSKHLVEMQKSSKQLMISLLKLLMVLLMMPMRDLLISKRFKDQLQKQKTLLMKLVSNDKHLRKITI